VGKEVGAADKNEAPKRECRVESTTSIFARRFLSIPKTCNVCAASYDPKETRETVGREPSFVRLSSPQRLLPTHLVPLELNAVIFWQNISDHLDVALYSCGSEGN
jgi:hypothetical protein